MPVIALILALGGFGALAVIILILWLLGVGR